MKPVPKDPVVVGGDELETLTNILNDEDQKASVSVIGAALNALLDTVVPMLDAGAVFGPDRRMSDHWLSINQAANIVNLVVRGGDNVDRYTAIAVKKRITRGALKAFITPYGRLVHLNDLVTFLKHEYPDCRARLEAML